MKGNFYILFVLVLSQTYAQFGSQQIITTDAIITSGAFAVDIDGDGDKDILSSSRAGNFNIAWFENLDGLGNFGPPNIIDNDLFDQSYSIYSADFDNDGDFDVITTAFSLNKVIWYENIDGQGSFSSQKIISNNAVGAFSAIAADITGNGFMDIITASNTSGLAWHENLDGNGNFSASKIIDNVILGSRSVVAADMDSDGDLDVVGNTSNIADIVWYENLDGLGNFGPPIDIYDSGSYSNVIFVADVDSDGDMDVFSASPGDNEVAWYENLDGLGNFGPKNSITNSLLAAWTVHAVDLDNDGDIDVLATSVETFGGEVVWFENLDGQGFFGSKIIITTEVQFPRRVYAADLDNDGDIDPISVSQNDDKIAWYENYTILGVEENEVAIFKIYPNPTDGIIFINTENQTILNVSVLDILGKSVLKINEGFKEINISQLENGMYFLKIATLNGDLVQKILKE
jgi:hypothetical protein